ncbi:Hypoxia-inducible factor 1-alpha inhibitor (Hypoxia-inducible factor asparagine hydroxylase) [Durusdinium trenchii]|uniref:Hypoxia-inducible factor 1-alpha inhibitor (Hypoxia-inducible factor asparagine hydroxylase) n=1 Tax=Durusdinium trenchii TaxID=1381693 RepID=A0ABP0R0J6_9DINO
MVFWALAILALFFPAVGQLVNITFVNDLKAVDCSLLWHGPIDSGPRADFGPVPAQGGQKVLEVVVGHRFSVTRAGSLEPLLQFDITSDVHHYSINESIAVGRPVPDPDSAEPSSCAADCRSAASCDQCVQLTGCGWSVVRQQCFPGHPFATENSECPETKSGTLQTWLEEAATLMDPEASGFGSASLRAAYRALQHANLQASSEGADPVVPTMDVPSSVFMAELAAKLDAVFDDADATELLAKSRHEIKTHRKVTMVKRCKLSDALPYISRGEPVVITDFFRDDPETHPVPHKWTLEYLKRFMHRGFYNVAADFKSVCCQYYEPRNISAQAGYPYPFNPRTHLYRDRFSGFVDTLRAKRTSDQKEPMLHYFHDVVMERDGKPVVAGQAAPPPLDADLAATLAALRPLAQRQAFFAGVANAKLWIGQRGVTMPLHYDSADNLYIMAWGRKRVTLAEPGQLRALYPFPNGHPHAGSSQVNISHPDWSKHPGFVDATLWETVIGPGGVFFLPGHWWHQFEQPFEDTASLNLWSYESPQAPPIPVRDERMRLNALHDYMEKQISSIFKNKAGMTLASLAAGRGGKKRLTQANETLHQAVETWRKWMLTLPNAGTPLPSAEALVQEFLELRHKHVMKERWPGWSPGVEWNMSALVALEPPELRARCVASTEKTATYASVCNWPA